MITLRSASLPLVTLVAASLLSAQARAEGARGPAKAPLAQVGAGKKAPASNDRPSKRSADEPSPATTPSAVAEPVDPAVPAAAALPSGEQDAQVNVQSNEPDLVVGLVRSRSIGVAYGQGVSATVAGVGWDEKCTAPCSFETKAGLREFAFRGPSNLTFQEFRVRPGQNNVYVDTGSWGMRLGGGILAYTGLPTLLVGGTLFLVSALDSSSDGSGSSSVRRWALPLTLGGAVALGGGLTLAYLGRVKVEDMGPGAKSGASESMLQLKGSF